jgi:hypothetical protein
MRALTLGPCWSPAFEIFPTSLRSAHIAVFKRTRKRSLTARSVFPSPDHSETTARPQRDHKLLYVVVVALFVDETEGCDTPEPTPLNG